MPRPDARSTAKRQASSEGLRRSPIAFTGCLVACLVLAFSVVSPAYAADSKCPDDAPAAAPAKDAVVDQKKSATLLFIPGPVRTPEPAMTADLEQLPGFSVGLFSPTLGRYSPTQMMLDISQGSRVATSLYKPITPQPPGLIATGAGGQFVGWNPLVARADAVPGEVVPGLLACSAEHAKKAVSWVGFAGSSTLTGIAAADAKGRIPSVRQPFAGKQVNELLDAQTQANLVVAALPAGGIGYGIARELSAADPERLIIVVQAPPDPARTRLLTIAVRGIGGPGGLKSATTRRPGLVAATDVAPTILDRLQVELPPAMQGQPIVSAPRMSAAQLNQMNDRLALIAGRRAPLGKSVLILGCFFLIFLLLAGRIAGRYAETARLAQRLVGLAVLWIPTMLLVTAAIRPSRAIEADIAFVGSLVLAFITDKFVKWPRALWVPALVAIVAHGVDFLFLNAHFTGESLLGSNPLYGARFFGVGNELEAVLSVSTVIGLGAWLCDRGIKNPARWFAAGGVVMALFLGAGRLGADVGGVIYIAAAFGVAALYAAKMKFTAGRVALLILIPIVGLALIAGLDQVTGGESHLTRTIVEANSFGDLWKVADRRFSASIEGAKSDGIWILVIVAMLLMLWAWLRRERLFSLLTAPGEDPAARRPLRAGMIGGLGGTLVGAVANDSGPAILLIGTIYLGMALLYLRGRPPSGIME
jgi:hypothetical protein